MREFKTQRLIDSKGFTLIEFLIATVLFSVALLGIATLAAVVINGNSISKQISTATMLSQQQMENYINKGFANFTTGTVTEAYGTIASADGSTALYTGYQRVSQIESGPVANMRKLTVTVYSPHGNVPVSFCTLIAK